MSTRLETTKDSLHYSFNPSCFTMCLFCICSFWSPSTQLDILTLLQFLPVIFSEQILLASAMSVEWRVGFLVRIICDNNLLVGEQV